MVENGAKMEHPLLVVFKDSRVNSCSAVQQTFRRRLIGLFEYHLETLALGQPTFIYPTILVSHVLFNTTEIPSVIGSSVSRACTMTSTFTHTEMTPAHSRSTLAHLNLSSCFRISSWMLLFLLQLYSESQHWSSLRNPKKQKWEMFLPDD